MCLTLLTGLISPRSGLFHGSCASRSQRLLWLPCSTVWLAFSCCYATGVQCHATAPCITQSMPSLWWVDERKIFFFSFLEFSHKHLEYWGCLYAQAVMINPDSCFVSWGIAQRLVLVHRLSHPGHLSHWGNPPPKYTGKLHFNNFLECCLKIKIWDLGYNYHCKSSLLFTSNPSCLNVLFSSRKWTISVQQLWFSTQSTCAVSGSPNNKHLVPCDMQTLSFCVTW